MGKQATEIKLRVLNFLMCSVSLTRKTKSSTQLCHACDSVYAWDCLPVVCRNEIFLFYLKLVTTQTNQQSTPQIPLKHLLYEMLSSTSNIIWAKQQLKCVFSPTTMHLFWAWPDPHFKSIKVMAAIGQRRDIEVIFKGQDHNSKCSLLNMNWQQQQNLNLKFCIHYK